MVATHPSHALAMLESPTDLQRLASSEEVARATLFLASVTSVDEARLCAAHGADLVRGG